MTTLSLTQFKVEYAAPFTKVFRLSAKSKIMTGSQGYTESEEVEDEMD